MEEAGENWDRRGDMEWENNVIVFQLKKKKKLFVDAPGFNYYELSFFVYLFYFCF